MIDIHTHVLNGVDDGSDTLGLSVAILRLAEEQGVTDIILTPHYIVNSRVSFTNEQVKEKFEELKNTIKKENINLNIYLGNEVYVDSLEIVPKIKSKEVYTLNDSKYLLIEFPMEKIIDNSVDIIYEIRMLGITPIIAHPERCNIFLKNKKLLDKCIEEGALIQVNVGSILGHFGRDIKKYALKLLKEGKINFIATDSHSLRREEYSYLSKVDKELEKVVGKYEKNKLLVYNARNVLINKDIEE